MSSARRVHRRVNELSNKRERRKRDQTTYSLLVSLFDLVIARILTITNDGTGAQLARVRADRMTGDDDDSSDWTTHFRHAEEPVVLVVRHRSIV
jgi:hypothetical protein